MAPASAACARTGISLIAARGVHSFARACLRGALVPKGGKDPAATPTPLDDPPPCRVRMRAHVCLQLAFDVAMHHVRHLGTSCAFARMHGRGTHAWQGGYGTCGSILLGPNSGAQQPASTLRRSSNSENRKPTTNAARRIAAYIVMAYIVMACIVMAYIVMAAPKVEEDRPEYGSLPNITWWPTLPSG